MGLFGALFAGVSGLGSQSNKIGQISNNIANVNTVGFKEESASFNTLVVPSGTTTFSPGGVISNNNQLVSKQGLIQATSSGTDLAISGNGFFAVSSTPTTGGQLLYTRVGSFTQDANGNFVNSNGMYLQGWLLSSTGAKPSNSTDPTTSLSTVKIQSNASGVAAPTTQVSIAANLNASLLPTTQGGQPILLGAGETVGFNTNNIYNATNSAKDLIASNEYGNATASGMVRGDSFTINTNGAASAVGTFTYGGFSAGRSITDSSSLGNGDSATEGGSATPTAATSYYNRSNPFSFTGSATPATATTITIAVPYTGLSANQTIDIEGVAAAGVGGITGTELNGQHQIVSVSNAGTAAATVTISVTPAAATTTTATGGGTGISISALQPQSFRTLSNPIQTGVPSGGNVTIMVTTPTAHGYVSGQSVDMEGITGTVDGISSSVLNGKHTNITVTGPNTFTFTVPAGAGTVGGVTGGGSNVSVANRTYPFAGNILDASSAAGDFLGASTTAPFDSTALLFNISTSSGVTNAFKYQAGSPDTSKGQFNSLNTLVEAINATSDLTARVVNGRLTVGSKDANEGITFVNGSTNGSATTGHGIDWKGELGLQDVTPASLGTGTKRFDSLNSLATQINSNAAFTATVNTSGTGSTISINASDPGATIVFSDGVNAINTALNGATNVADTGSVLSELGFKSALGFTLNTTNNAGPFGAPGLTTGLFQAKYLASDPTRNMSSGAITPQFTRNITVYDSLGVSHTLAFNVAKVAINQWAVEITAVPASDLNPISSSADGKVAAGTIDFNTDGTFKGDSLGNITINWADGSSTSNISLNLGTANKTDGLSQFSAASNVTLVNQDGSSAGQLTGISITSEGLVVESFSNGQSHAVYKIPLVQVNNPNGLFAVSGNAFKDTQESGTALSVDAGTGGTGSIESSSLEQSTVDLSAQLTNLIVAQQAYGANSKLLTVADQLLQQLDQIIQ